MVQADVIVGEIPCQRKFLPASFCEKNSIWLSLMASNYPTFELGFFDDIQDLEKVSEILETSEASDVMKGQQLSESATGENNHFANLSERDLEKLLEAKQSKKTKKNTNWCVSTFKGEFQT